jgi:hypothetical protein
MNQQTRHPLMPGFFVETSKEFAVRGRDYWFVFEAVSDFTERRSDSRHFFGNR